jgi:hypothetical protein
MIMGVAWLVLGLLNAVAVISEIRMLLALPAEER